jgi:nucleotide-binding universal stress UspA family protein
MFNRILVPLDGSELAERAIEPAVVIAQKFGCEIVLLRVVVVEEMAVEAHGLGTAYYDVRAMRLQQRRKEAFDYLNTIRGQWRDSGVPMRGEVVNGAPPEMIVETTRLDDTDLIVMSTHGRSGLSRLIYGSVAEAVLRGADVPVLLIPSRA